MFLALASILLLSIILPGFVNSAPAQIPNSDHMAITTTGKPETVDQALHYHTNAAFGWVEQWSYTYGGYGHSQFAQPIGDIDEDGVNEVIVGGYESPGNGRARILSYDKITKTYLEEYHWTYAGGEYNSPSGACVVDLDDDGDLEFVMSWTYSGMDGIYAYDWNSSTLTTLDVYTGTGFDLAFDVYACDYDDDGDVEVLIANAANARPGGYHVTALGWDNINDEFTEEAFWKLSGYEYSMECPMIWSGDTDNDGKTEVVACISDSYYSTAGTWALNWDPVLGEWNEELVYGHLIGGGTHYGAAVGDVNGNGIPEIGIGNSVEGYYGAAACLVEWNTDTNAYGKVWEGSWPEEECIIEAVAIDDADNDGINEFCAGGGNVHVIGWTGTEYVEESTITRTVGLLSSVVIGDCDTDGLNELKVCDIIGLGPGKEWIFKYPLKPPDEILIEKVIDPPTLVHDLIAFRYPELLSPEDKISPVVPIPMEVPFAHTWFYWLCDVPYAMFAHDTRYVFIDHLTGDYVVEVGEWWPVLNEKELWATPEEFWNKDYWVYSTYAPEINVVFEEAHLPIYTIGINSAAEGTGGYSTLASYLTANGYNVSTIDPGTTIDSSVLAPADVLVIVAPQNSYSTYEIDTIVNWVKGNGSLLLISEWDDPLGLQASTVASKFGVSLAGDAIHDTDEYVGGNTYWPYYHGANLLAHPITEGVTRVEMYAGDGIESSPANELRLIVTDSDGTATWDDGSPAYGVPVMSAFVGDTVGSGRLVIITDSNVWDSAYDSDEDGTIDFYDSDNEILALNSIDWLARARTHIPTSSSYESRFSTIWANIALAPNAPSQSVKRALIILGAGEGFGGMKTTAENWRKLLMKQFNYSDDEIIYLSPEKHATYIDYITNEENVNNTVQELSRILKSGDSLYVFIVTHGGKENITDRQCTHGYVYLIKNDVEVKLWDNNLIRLLSKINNAVNITVVIQSCYSGVFIDDLCTLPQVKIIVTSTDWKSVSYMDVDPPNWGKLSTAEGVRSDPNGDTDEGGEFSSGLIEDLKDMTQVPLFIEAFKGAKAKDASYINRDLLETEYGERYAPFPYMKMKMFEGDVTYDGKVDIIDIATVAKAFDSDPSHRRWNPIADINCDGKVDIIDIALAAKNLGKEYF